MYPADPVGLISCESLHPSHLSDRGEPSGACSRRTRRPSAGRPQKQIGRAAELAVESIG